MPAPWASVVRLKVKGRIQGQDYNNVMHLATNTVINDATELNQLLQALCTAMIVCLTTTLIPAVSSDFTLLSVEGTQLFPTLSDPIEVPVVADNVGTGGPTSVSFAATLVNVRSGLGGRKGKGKIFLPPASEANTANSEITATSQGEFNDFLACVATKFIGALATEPWRLGVLSRKDLTTNPGDFNGAFREATTLLLNPVVAKMGSRKRGSGN